MKMRPSRKVLEADNERLRYDNRVLRAEIRDMREDHTSAISNLSIDYNQKMVALRQQLAEKFSDKQAIDRIYAMITRLRKKKTR